MNLKTHFIKSKEFIFYTSTENYCVSYDIVAHELANPHFNSFLDLNGDCRSDLFLMSQKTSKSGTQLYFETWIKQKDGSFCLIDYTPVNFNVTSVNFADFNFDGAIDIIIAEEKKN